jgi:hypothetical protein
MLAAPASAQTSVMAPQLSAVVVAPAHEAQAGGPVAAASSAIADDGGPGKPRELPWAPVPALPKLLTTPPPREAAEPTLPVLKEPDRVSVLGDHRLHRMEHALAFGAHRHMSESGHPQPSSRMPKVLLSRPGDPLAALQVEEEPSREARRRAREFILPFANGRVTSLFNQGRRHPAIDLAGKLGSPVLATTARQRVTFTGWRGGYGRTVMARDDKGRTHLYAHLQSITARVGQLLEQGNKLGHLGSTGHSTGPHVHYEVRTPKGGHINPVTLLFPGRGVRVGYAWRDAAPGEEGARVASAMHAR